MAKPSLFEFNESFLQALEVLNPEQRQAVEQFEGPMLVIAGPGAGKTHVLAARIGKILLETDTSPQNILCLTFTEAGVLAMRQRLLSWIGPEAHKIAIFTFHSFCNSIIQDNLELFGITGLEPLHDLERMELIRGMLDRLPNTHLLKWGYSDVYFYEERLSNLFRLMKRENWNTQHVQEQSAAYLDSLSLRPDYLYKTTRGDFKKGDLKIAKIKEETERIERLKAGAELFQHYQDALRKMRRYDYEDMILWVLTTFDQHPFLLRNFQERFLYLLVDEFQDTNGAQNQLLRKLVDYWQAPNLFIVGDDDQSIYEFQGARLKNLKDMYTAYADYLQLVVLDRNYRSTPAILESANAVIRYNRQRIVGDLESLGVQKTLTAASAQEGRAVEPLSVIEYPGPLQEQLAVVESIEQLSRQGVPLKEIAIIYPKHRIAEPYQELLKKKNIAFQVKKRTDALQSALLKNVLEILIYLDKEYQKPYSGEIHLYRMLYFGAWDIPAADIAKMALRRQGLGLYWRDLIADTAGIEEMRLPSAKVIAEVSRFVEESLRNIADWPVSDFVQKALNRSGILAFALENPDRLYLLEVLQTFVQFVQEESIRRPAITLTSLLDTVERMQSSRLPLEVVRTVGRQDAVQLLSAHGAKGLEFQHVFLVDCVKANWEQTSRALQQNFSLPDTLTFSSEDDVLESRRRLFYVAVTRAKTNLNVSYSQSDKNGKETGRSQFVDELLEGGKAQFTLHQPETQWNVNAMEISLQESPVLPVEYFDQEEIARFLQGFIMSVSAMNRYLRCPLSFYHEHVLRAPLVENAATLYGTALHNALCWYFGRVNRSRKKLFPPPADLLRQFKKEMSAKAGLFAKNEYQRRLEQGFYHLEKYYYAHVASWHENVLTEYHIRHTEVNGVPLTGIIDRLDFDAKGAVHIIDYKSGSQEAKKISPPSPNAPHGGSYWRQLAFYTVLYESFDRQDRKISTATISYLEENKNRKMEDKTIHFNTTDRAFIKNLIADTYTKIKEGQFQDGCNEPTCSWCQLTKERYAVDVIWNVEKEEMDER